MKSYNWGIIGPGNIARDFLKDMVYVSAPQKVTAVLSHRMESAEKFAQEFEIEGTFVHSAAFFANGKFDIVYIATPHTSHFDEIKACLTNRIPVLCEKPMVINLEQFDELAKLSKKNNTFLMEGMWVRMLPSFRKVLELIQQNKIGDLISIKAGIYFKAPREADNRYYDPEKGGGSLLDLGAYGIFLSTLLMGIPQNIKAIGRLSETKVDEACAVLLSYKNGRYSMLESSLLLNQNGPAEIYGTNGVIKILNPWFEKSPAIEVEMNDGSKERFDLSWEGRGLYFEIEEVINCISNNKIESNLMPLNFSRETLRIMDEIREQIYVVYEADK